MKKKQLKKLKKSKPVTRIIRDDISDDYPDSELLFMTQLEFDDAIIGVCDGINRSPCVAYDYDKVIKANINMGCDNQRFASRGVLTPVECQ